MATILDGQGQGTVLNDDPLPAISINDVIRFEGNSGTSAFVFTVSLSNPSSQSISVTYATASGTAGGADYQSASGILTFGPGETSQTVSVLVNGDRNAEPENTFFVNLSAPSNATIADGQGVGHIQNDEPHISISDVTLLEGSGTTLFTFTVTLSAAYDQAVTVSFRTVNGTANSNDYAGRSGTITFAPGETSKTITISVKGDNKREANETFFVDLFNNSSNSLITKNRGIGTIVNDD
jgi:chitinase